MAYEVAFISFHHEARVGEAADMLGRGFEVDSKRLGNLDNGKLRLAVE